jgi:hypothetical protein
MLNTSFIEYCVYRIGIITVVHLKLNAHIIKIKKLRQAGRKKLKAFF